MKVKLDTVYTFHHFQDYFKSYKFKMLTICTTDWGEWNLCGYALQFTSLRRFESHDVIRTERGSRETCRLVQVPVGDDSPKRS